MSSSSSLVFDGIRLKSSKDNAEGRLKMSSDSVEWSAEDDPESRVSIAASDVGAMKWTSVHGGQSQLTCAEKSGGPAMRFTGTWDVEAFTRLEYFVKENYSIDMERSKLATKGWNWGAPVFQGRSMSFEVDGKEAFDLPLDQVVQVTENKHEVAMEFKAENDANDQDELIEMRFLVPPAQAAEDDEDSELTPAQKFLADVRKRASVGDLEEGSGIVKFDAVNFVTPRGKYDMEMAEDFLTLRGQSYSYKVPYTQISRLFLLPRPGQTAISFVISVDPPIRQGKTGYQHLITQFPSEHETSVTLNLSAAEIAEKYPGKLEKEMTGATYEVLTKVFKVLSKKRMSIPKGFRSARGDSCVRCAVGNQEGLLYVLEKSFMFVNKPAMHLRFDDIQHVDLDRTSEGVNSRALKSWDLIVAHKNGTQHTFSNVDKNDYEPLVTFLSGQKVKIIGGQDPQQPSEAEMMGDDDDDDDEESEDEDFDGGAAESSSEEDSSDDDVDDDASGDEAVKSKKKAKRKAPDGSPKRQKKLKLGPKRAQTSYFLFVAAERDAVKEANPDASVTDITKILGSRWGQMDDAAKAPYEQKAAADKVRYAEELKAWQAAHPDEVAAMDAQGKSGRAAKKKQKTGPKRATTAYFYFTADMRERVKEENPDLKVTEIAKVIGAKWKALTDEEKQKYNDMADKDKERYASEKSTWDEDHPDEAKPSPKKRAPKKKAAAAAAAAEDDSDDDSDDDVSVDGDSDDDSE